MPTLLATLKMATGLTPEPQLISLLKVIRSARDPRAAGPLADLLSHRSSVYQDRDQLQVIFLRSYLFVILSEIGVPDSALPFILESVAHVDERTVPLEVGAAARAVASLGSRGRGFYPYLLALLDKRFAEEEFSLDEYGAGFTPVTTTTIQLEAINALANTCSSQDIVVVERLRTLTKPDPQRDPRLIAAALHAVEMIR